MPLRRAALVLASFLALTSAGSAQTGLRDLLTDFLRNGITLAEPPVIGGVSHVAHFNSLDSPQFIALRQFNDALALQLSSFPLASSAGGFTYRFDPSLGFTRASDSFGPIYAERPDTMGKGKFDLGLNHSRFTFDRINDLSLTGGDIKLVFTHNPVPLYVAGDVITANLSLKVSTEITALVAWYGLADRFDIGAAIPYINVDLSARTDATIQRLATGPTDNPPTIHRFPGETSTASFQSSGHAKGIGDILLRAKYQVLRNPWGGLALALDVRMPTGEERDLLGTGAWTGKALLIASAHLGGFSPHVNGGYAVSTDPKDDRAPEQRAVIPRRTIPDEISLTAGFDWAVDPRVTLAVDVLGRTDRNAQFVSVEQQTFHATTNENPPRQVAATFPRLTTRRKDLTTWTGSVGLKVNPIGNVLVTLNALFSLNREGLQDKFSPLVGLGYTF